MGGRGLNGNAARALQERIEDELTVGHELAAARRAVAVIVAARLGACCTGCRARRIGRCLGAGRQVRRRRATDRRRRLARKLEPAPAAAAAERHCARGDQQESGAAGDRTGQCEALGRMSARTITDDVRNCERGRRFLSRSCAEADPGLRSLETPSPRHQSAGVTSRVRSGGPVGEARETATAPARSGAAQWDISTGTDSAASTPFVAPPTRKSLSREWP